MKKFTKLLSVLLVLALALSVVACSSYGKVEKAIKDLGFTAVQNEQLEKQYEDKERVTNVHVLEKASLLGKDYVVVLEFKSTEKLVEFFNESETLKGFAKDLSSNEDVKAMHAALEEYGLVCDNCIVIPTLTNFAFVMPAIAELNK